MIKKLWVFVLPFQRRSLRSKGAFQRKWDEVPTSNEELLLKIAAVLQERGETADAEKATKAATRLGLEAERALRNLGAEQYDREQRGNPPPGFR